MAEISNKLRKKLEARQKASANRGSFKYLVIKEGTKRVRPLNVGKDNDFLEEVVFFYLGDKLKGVISPASYGEKCALMRHHEKLMNSGEQEDKDFVKAHFRADRRFMMMVLPYKDEKGKEIDTDMGPKLILITPTLEGQITDLFLDEEAGDFMDPITGFDLKLKRTGKGKNDTKYAALACKPTKLSKEYRKEYDLTAEIKKIIPTYEETKELLKEFLNGSNSEDEETNSEKRKKKKRSSDM